MTIELAQFDPSSSYVGQKQFDCGQDVINGFARRSLKPQVKKNLSVAYVLLDKAQNDRFVGFYTIAQHRIDSAIVAAMHPGSLPQTLPCSRLIMLGVDKGYQGQRLGLMLMQHALTLTKSIGQQIGSFGMYLDADPKAVSFYTKIGFSLLEGDTSPIPSPMFIPLSAIP